MSSDKDQEIKRNKQSRRKLLKSMAVGSGAVVAGKSVPEEWMKPIVDSVILPAHAETTGGEPPAEEPPASCSVSGNVGSTFTAFGDAASGTYALPGTYTEFVVASDSSTITLTPSFTVTPGVTDAFNLAVVSTEPIAGSQLNQNVTPSANGVLAFNQIENSDPSIGDEANFVFTLTPDNASLCGGPQVIDITFDTSPPPAPAP